ncbi:MAG: glutamine--fructose-6-phosphate transaminase (isomerizing) [Elusimicrobiota bacterium]
MCGIVGYIGEKEVWPILIEGLKRLEYRGYDSAGVAIVADNKIQLRKKLGKLKVMEASLKEDPIHGTTGIGHTRWATHGVPSEVNSHPHADCTGRLVVVHNGIIENFHELREELTKEGHKFVSQTDTEVVAHLIERQLKKGAKKLEDAVKLALKEVEGAYALGIYSLDDPDKMVAARNGSPLVVGLGKGENFIASDVPAILKHTRDVMYLDDKEIIIITKEKVVVTDLDGNVKNKPVKRIDWDSEAAEKEGYPHFMLKEIYQQPKVIRDALRGRISKDRKRILLEDMNISEDELKKIKKIFIVACGTAFYAGFTGKYFIEECVGLPVEVDLASEFRYRSPKVGADTLVMSVTQSGETADTLASIRYARQMGSKVVSVCNVVGSTIARESDGVIYTQAGPEIGVASTKAYTSQLTAFYLFTIYMGKLRGTISDLKAEGMIKELEQLPDIVDRVIKDQKELMTVVDKFYNSKNALFLGRSYNYPNALEGALKLKEISYIHAEGYAAGEMKHGPIALIDEEMLVVCIAVDGPVYDKMISNIQEVRARKGRVVIIVTEGNNDAARYAEYLIHIPKTSEIFSPIVAVTPLQLFAYHVAVKRGCDVDQPRNLAKSVTVE